MSAEELIKVFEEVREIPYHLPENPSDKDFRCWGKNRLLVERFKELGYESRIRVCSFLWSKQHFPKELLLKAPKEKDFHAFVEIKLNGEWIKVDASFESKYPFHNEWDGKTSTKISINYDKIYSSEESKEINEKENSSHKSRQDYEFYKKVNKFFSELRN